MTKKKTDHFSIIIIIAVIIFFVILVSIIVGQRNEFNQTLAKAIKPQADDYCKLQQYEILKDCDQCEIKISYLHDEGEEPSYSNRCYCYQTINYTSSIVFANQTFSCVGGRCHPDCKPMDKYCEQVSLPFSFDVLIKGG